MKYLMLLLILIAGCKEPEKKFHIYNNSEEPIEIHQVIPGNAGVVLPNLEPKKGMVCEWSCKESK